MRQIKRVFHLFFINRQCNSALVWKLIVRLVIAAQLLFGLGCNFNILGGSNSEISSGYTPGLRTESSPPSISPFADLDMDENDSVTIPFTISDPDTFLFCSGISIAARSSNHAIIAPVDMQISGSYPNCNLTINSRSVAASTEIKITVEVYDFWSTVGASFNLMVRKVEKPGPFKLTDSKGLRKSLVTGWTNADYMDGSSAKYYLYFKKIADQSLVASPFAGIMPVYTPSPAASQSTFTEIINVRSQYWVAGPDYVLEDSTVYEVYVTARNSFNLKNPTVPPTESDHIFVRTLDRYAFKVREFVASSRQDFKPPAIHDGACVGGVIAGSPSGELCVDSDRFFVQASVASPMERTTTPTGSGRYKTYLNAQGLMFGEDP